MASKILIIDDDQDDIELTRVALESTGRDLETLVAFNGEEGLRLLKEQDSLPELILLDLKMPGMNGIEVLREIRADARLQGIRVAIFTTSSLDSDQDEAYRAGADIFLHKAFDLTRFNGDIEMLLDRYLRDSNVVGSEQRS